MERGAAVDDIAGELVVAPAAKLHEPACQVIKRATLDGASHALNLARQLEERCTDRLTMDNGMDNPDVLGQPPS